MLAAFLSPSLKKKNKKEGTNTDDGDDTTSSRQTINTINPNVTDRRSNRVSNSPSRDVPSSHISSTVTTNQMDDYDNDGQLDTTDAHDNTTPSMFIETHPIPFAEQFHNFGVGDTTTTPRNIGHGYITHYTHQDRSKMKVADALDFQSDATKGIKHPIKPVSLHDTLTDTHPCRQQDWKTHGLALESTRKHKGLDKAHPPFRNAGMLCPDPHHRQTRL